MYLDGKDDRPKWKRKVVPSMSLLAREHSKIEDRQNEANGGTNERQG